MIDKTSGSGVETELQAAADISADGAAPAEAFPAQGKGAAGYPQGRQASRGTADLGQSLVIQGGHLVEEGMTLLAQGQKAEGMRLLRDGAGMQHRGSLLCSRPGRCNGERDEEAGPQTPSCFGNAIIGSLPLQYASLALRYFRPLQPEF